MTWDDDVYEQRDRSNRRAKQAENERDYYKAVLEQIANDGCGLSYTVVDRTVDCRTHNPDDPSEWCWCCIARHALEGKP